MTGIINIQGADALAMRQPFIYNHSPPVVLLHEMSLPHLLQRGKSMFHKTCSRSNYTAVSNFNYSEMLCLTTKNHNMT